jgi:hypothetical protein
MFDRIDEQIISMDNQMEKNCEMLENKADEIVRGIFIWPAASGFFASAFIMAAAKCKSDKAIRNGLKGTTSCPRM